MKTCTDFLEKSSNAIFVVDRHSRIVFANGRAGTLTKQRPEELVGKHFFDVVSAKELTVALEDVQLLPEGTMLYCSDKSAEASAALMIHQLKSPLATMRWMCELLLQRSTVIVDDRKVLREIYSADQRAIGIVNDLLQLSKFEAGNIEVSCAPRNLSDAMAGVVRLLAPQAEGKGQNIAVDDAAVDAPALLDEELFIAAFTNILDNAINYGNPDSVINVRAQKDADGKAYVISVRDHGMAIAPEDQQRLFTKFYRTEAAKSMKPAGTGLGLYIVKAAVEACGGKVWVTSDAALDTTFFFTVPIAQTPSAA